MAKPVVSETTQEAYDRLGSAWTNPDESVDWHLLKFIQAVTLNLTVINDLVRDTDEGPGWSIVLDADRVAAKYFPWLSQFNGTTVDLGLSEDDQRQQLKEVAGFRRGTIASMIAAAQPYLTGTKTVTITERDTSAYHFSVRTFTAETPDSAKVLTALLSQKPAGLVMDFSVTSGLTYGDLKATGKTYHELTVEFPTSGDMKRAQTV